MLTDLRTRFDALNRESASVKATVCALSPEHLTRAPSPGEWSPLQIVHHLVLSDETVGLPAKTALSDKPLGAFLFRLGLMALNRNVRLPIPDPALEPTSEVPLETLLERWDAAHRELEAFLEDVTEERTRSKPFAHPIIGPLTSKQLLELGKAHTAYHRRQLEALQTLGAPKT